jgi:hypothetical protein
MLEAEEGRPPFKGVSLSIDAGNGRKKHATAACVKRNRMVNNGGDWALA